MQERPLWAPWRIEYILSKKDPGCFLCGREAPGAGADEDMVVARGRDVFAIMNAFPYNSGHVMVVPYAHVADLSALPEAALAELMEMTRAAKETLERVMRPDGFNIGMNLGLAAGAGVEAHIHMHVVPRWAGDTNFMPVLGGPRVVPQALRDTARLLRSSWTPAGGGPSSGRS